MSPSLQLPVKVFPPERKVAVSCLSPPDSSTSASVPVFLAKPSVVLFTEYTVGQVYEVVLIETDVDRIHAEE